VNLVAGDTCLAVAATHSQAFAFFCRKALFYRKKSVNVVTEDICLATAAAHSPAFAFPPKKIFALYHFVPGKDAQEQRYRSVPGKDAQQKRHRFVPDPKQRYEHCEQAQPQTPKLACLQHNFLFLCGWS
jgi:hypothetical protein